MPNYGYVSDMLLQHAVRREVSHRGLLLVLSENASPVLWVYAWLTVGLVGCLWYNRSLIILLKI
jgi:hypothetical protein